MKKPVRYLRYLFWRLLGGGLQRMARFCRLRQARCCGCGACYVTLNHDRIVRQALEDAFREMDGEKPVDRRPS